VRAFVTGLMLLAGLILLAACANLGSLLIPRFCYVRSNTFNHVAGSYFFSELTRSHSRPSTPWPLPGVTLYP
jgi:hypothetical protein